MPGEARPVRPVPVDECESPLARSVSAAQRPDPVTYDNYLPWMALLVQMAGGVAGAPVDELLSVNLRMQIAGGGRVPGQGFEAVPLEDLVRQQRLLEAMAAFRPRWMEALKK